jgi:hypothetical protein
VPRLGLTPVAEALVQLVGADETAAAGVPGAALAWVAQTSVLPQLLALCAARASPAGFLCRAGRAGRQGLLGPFFGNCGACAAAAGVPGRRPGWGPTIVAPVFERKILSLFLSPTRSCGLCITARMHCRGPGRNASRLVAGRRAAGCRRAPTPGVRGRRRLNSAEPPNQLHENAAEVLGAVARARACPLTRGLAAPGALAALAAQAFPPEPRPRRVQAGAPAVYCPAGTRAARAHGA